MTLNQDELERIRERLRADKSYRSPNNVPQPKHHFPGSNQSSRKDDKGIPPNVSRDNNQKSSMRGDQNRNRRWNALLRIGAFVLSIVGMYISATFSVDGFSFSIDNRKWIGWAIAFILIMLESVWQKFGDNMTLFALAFVCYTYGVITNVVGIMANRVVIDQVTGAITNSAGWETWAIAIVFGILLEIFPEPVLAWAISGDTSSDPLRKLIAHIEDDKSVLRQFNSES